MEAILGAIQAAAAGQAPLWEEDSPGREDSIDCKEAKALTPKLIFKGSFCKFDAKMSNLKKYSMVRMLICE